MYVFYAFPLLLSTKSRNSVLPGNSYPHIPPRYRGRRFLLCLHLYNELFTSSNRTLTLGWMSRTRKVSGWKKNNCKEIFSVRVTVVVQIATGMGGQIYQVIGSTFSNKRFEDGLDWGLKRAGMELSFFFF